MKRNAIILASILAMSTIPVMAQEVDEATVYKTLMQSQTLSQQQLAQQSLLAHQQAAQSALQAHTIESMQAAKIASLKAQLAAQQPQLAYNQPQPIAPQYAPQPQPQPQPQQYASPYAYHGQAYNVHPLPPMTQLQRQVIPTPTTPPEEEDNRDVTPVTVPTPQSLSPGEEELTPDEAAQEKYEQEHSIPPAATVTPANDPLGIKPVIYLQRPTAPMVVYQYARPVQYYYQPQMQAQRVVYAQPRYVTYQQARPRFQTASYASR